MLSTTVAEYVVRTGDHQSFYLAAGPADGPMIIFVHGWPELAISWRHQLPCLAALGYRAVAPDMIGLLDALGVEKAVWVGHDWGHGWSGASPAITPNGVPVSLTSVCPTTRWNEGWMPV